MKSKYFLKIITLLFSTITLLAQSEIKETPNKIYEGCCGTKPVEFGLGKATVFIPNIFTPNSDGLNDLFMPYSSDDIASIQSFTIKSAIGDTVLFYRSNFSYKDIKQFAWNGLRYNAESFETPYSGKFKYGMGVINKEGIGRVIEGDGCVVRCEKETNILKTKEGCYYPSQAAGTNNTGKTKGIGKLDKELVSQEKDCF